MIFIAINKQIRIWSPCEEIFFFLFSFFLKRKPSVWSNRDLSDANVTRILDKFISDTFNAWFERNRFWWILMIDKDEKMIAYYCDRSLILSILPFLFNCDISLFARHFCFFFFFFLSFRRRRISRINSSVFITQRPSLFTVVIDVLDCSAITCYSRSN